MGEAYPELLLALHKAQLQRLLSHLDAKWNILHTGKEGQLLVSTFTPAA